MLGRLMVDLEKMRAEDGSLSVLLNEAEGDAVWCDAPLRWTGDDGRDGSGGA
jgi:hypothetical protein